MTVPKWNPQRFDHEWKHANDTPARKPNRARIIALSTVMGLCIAGVAAASTDLAGGSESIGICHATGNEQAPYVLLHAAKDGYEHGHHRHHDTDFFVDAATTDCSGWVAPEPSDDGNVTDDADHADDVDDSDDALDTAGNENGSDDAEATDDTEDGESDDAEDSESDDAGDDQAEETSDSEEAEAGDNTSEEPAALPVDVAVVQRATQTDHDVTLTLRVRNVGSGNASDVSLTDTLPDVRRSWLLGGEDADLCMLDGNSLSCWFGPLDSGSERSITLRAYTDRIPCGQSMNNTAWISAVDDIEPRNDASSAGIAARYC